MSIVLPCFVQDKSVSLSLYGKRMMKLWRKDMPPRIENLFKGPKTDKYVVWRWWYKMLCQKVKSWLRKWKTIAFFGKKSPPVAHSYTRNGVKKGSHQFIYGIITSTPRWLIQLTENSFRFSFYTLSVYFKTTRFGYSLGTLLSGLSIFDYIQLLWL